jgi:hypothetical protein
MTGEARPLLLEHYNSNDTVTVGCLPVPIKDYGLLVQRHIVLAKDLWKCILYVSRLLFFLFVSTHTL